MARRSRGPGSLRCTLCGINYPMHDDFVVCPIHHEETDPDPTGTPDSDWKEQAEALYLRLMKEQSDAARIYPKIEGVTITEEHGLLWITHADLVYAGLRINRIGPSFFMFELDGWIYEIQGWDEPNRRWWVEKVGEAPTSPALAHQL